MVPAVRWLVVAAGALALAAAPAVVRAIPPQGSQVGAVQLADRISHAYDRGWSGEVVSRGTLQVPISGSGFGGVTRLLGERTDLRVWWHDRDEWRIARLKGAGESDLTLRDGEATKWDYESKRLTLTPYSSIRLPDDSDVVPTSLAHRMLGGAKRGELSRLPSLRIAGRSAAGLRLVPADERSTISHVDTWADDETGVPLRVEVYGEGDRRPVLSSEVIGFDEARPSGDEMFPRPDRSVAPHRGFGLDEAAGANVFAPFVPPDQVVGLPRIGNALDFGAVGVYGRGPTAILAIPVRGRVAGDLRDQLRGSAASREDGTHVALEIGPVSVLLADEVADGHFLVAGTVTPETLLAATKDLEAGVVRTNR